MGTDNLFQKKKLQAKSLARKKPSRQQYKKVLIVCEGSKTEPLYFTELKDHYEIDTANIRISGDCGSAPISVVKHGEELYKDEIKNCQDPYDKVFFVFDKDQHPSYNEALSRIAKLKPANRFSAVTSIPCFEVWILLHFNYSSAPFISNGGKSSGARVLEEIIRFWPDYKKGKSGSFKYLLKDIDMAKAYATRLTAECERNKSDNPLTKVHELVSYLQNIKSLD